MKVTASLNNFRRSAQKVRESAKIIVGLPVDQALIQLEHSARGDAVQLMKLLKSAVANAENNFKLDKDNLFISNIVANEGRTLKRWRPRAYGRAAQILKRSCSVILELDEVDPTSPKAAKGKRKEKTIEVEKKGTKGEKGVKGEKDGEKEEKDEDEKRVKEFEQKRIQEELERKGKSQVKGGAGKKVFRRKSF